MTSVTKILVVNRGETNKNTNAFTTWTFSLRSWSLRSILICFKHFTITYSLSNSSLDLILFLFILDNTTERAVSPWALLNPCIQVSPECFNVLFSVNFLSNFLQSLRESLLAMIRETNHSGDPSLNLSFLFIKKLSLSDTMLVDRESKDTLLESGSSGRIFVTVTVLSSDITLKGLSLNFGSMESEGRDISKNSLS